MPANYNLLIDIDDSSVIDIHALIKGLRPNVWQAIQYKSYTR